MSSIDVIYQAAVHLSGIGKTSKRPFDFAQVRYMMPVQTVSLENFQLSGYGAETQDLELASPDLIHKFSDLRPGQWVTLDLGPNPRNAQRNVCVGVRPHDKKETV